MVNSEKKVYLFANWKMYLNYDESVALAKNLVKENFAKNMEMVAFPSALAMKAVITALAGTDIKTGAQNVYWVGKGGYTGEVSAEMCRDAGCEYALVGHSERRHQFHESNHDARQKLEACLTAGLIPVLCVGETLKEKEESKAEETVEAQLRSAFHGLHWPPGIPLIIAYEPVWSIGTGNACDPVTAEITHRMILKFVEGLMPNQEPIVLYGGSVRPDNVFTYISSPHISGVLVGGASARLDSWAGIAKSALQ